MPTVNSSQDLKPMDSAQGSVVPGGPATVRAVAAIAMKDVRALIANRQYMIAIVVVPLVLVVVIPTVFILAMHVTGVPDDDLRLLLDLVAPGARGDDLETAMTMVMLNNVLPVFFLIIPIMASTVMSASSFVGEREKGTLETLLYAPLRIADVFRAKVLASFLVSMAVSLVSFVLMMAVVGVETTVVAGAVVAPSIGWLAVLLVVSPALTMIAITLIVRGSAKAHTVEQAQQSALFLVVPVLVLLVAQFSGAMLVGPWLMLALGMVLAAIAAVLVSRSFSGFGYERLVG